MTIKAIPAVKPTVINDNTISISVVSANEDSMQNVVDVLLKQYGLRVINPQVIDGVIHFDKIEIANVGHFDLTNVFATYDQDCAGANVPVGELSSVIVTTMSDANCFMFEAFECINLELSESVEYDILKQIAKLSQQDIDGCIDSDIRYTDSEVLLYPNCNIYVLSAAADMLTHRNEEEGKDFSLVSSGELQTITYNGLSLLMVNRTLFNFDDNHVLHGNIRCGDRRYNVTAIATRIDVSERMDAALLIIHDYTSPLGYSMAVENPIAAINFCVTMYYDRRLTTGIKAVAVNRLSMEHTWSEQDDDDRGNRRRDRRRVGFGRDRFDDEDMRDDRRSSRDDRRRDREARRDSREARLARDWSEEPTSNLDKLEAQQEKKNK